jgi:diaminopimelate epimerase
MRFTKMHGIGNDFILFHGFNHAIPDPGALALRLCDRHFGIGADGLILALPSDRADARMRILNRDGSEAEMCGNGLRCLGKFLYDTGLCRRTSLRVETLAGMLELTLKTGGDGEVESVTADMGAPCFDPPAIPVAADSNAITLEAGGHRLRFFCVSMGNPHAVTFDLYPDDETFATLGPILERHPIFPRRCNIEFCRVEGADARVRVWERGDGATLGCGTGACAVLAAGVRQGLLPRSAGILLPGGALSIRWDETGNHLFMTGPAETVFTGEIEQ